MCQMICSNHHLHGHTYNYLYCFLYYGILLSMHVNVGVIINQALNNCVSSDSIYITENGICVE